MTMTAVEVFQKIQNTKRTDIKKVVFFSPAASPGEYIRQGDVYITAVEGVKDLIPDPKPMAQLAPGATRGSRHVLSSLDNVKMFRQKNPTALDGPTIEVVGKNVVVEHPDHGHVELPPGFYAITYQRQMAEELRRAQD